MKLISLRAGRLAVQLAPEVGGSIARFVADGAVDLMRPAAPGALASGTAAESSCYPLVPFSGRIAHGRFAFDGQEIVVPSNRPGHRHPIHGDGWTRAWTVRRSDERRAELLYEHDGRQGWPFRYRASQVFRLDGDALTIAMSLDNLEPRPVPAGLGLHPYFVRDADTELSCRTRYMWRTDAEVLPIDRVPVPPEASFSTPRRVDAVTLDNGFEGWDGHAAIAWPTRRLRLELDATPPFRSLVIFVPPGKPYFCVEPASHVPGAIGSTRLASGGTLAGEIAFRLSNL